MTTPNRQIVGGNNYTPTQYSQYVPQQPSSYQQYQAPQYVVSSPSKQNPNTYYAPAPTTQQIYYPESPSFNNYTYVQTPNVVPQPTNTYQQQSYVQPLYTNNAVTLTNADFVGQSPRVSGQSRIQFIPLNNIDGTTIPTQYTTTPTAPTQVYEPYYQQPQQSQYIQTPTTQYYTSGPTNTAPSYQS
jgi:hypothetical protein